MIDVNVILRVDEKAIEIEFSPPIEDWPLGKISFSRAVQILNYFCEDLREKFINKTLNIEKLKYYILDKMVMFSKMETFLINVVRVSEEKPLLKAGLEGKND